MASGPDGALRFCVLGALEVSRGGAPVRLGGERQRTLLALFLLRANQLLGTEQLLDGLFGEGRRAGAANALRVAISRLRRDLLAGGGDSVLQTRPGGYALQLAGDQLDLAVFERLVGDGQALIAAGEPAAGAVRLREAVGLWRGPPLADLALVDGLQADIRRLEQLPRCRDTAEVLTACSHDSIIPQAAMAGSWWLSPTSVSGIGSRSARA